MTAPTPEPSDRYYGNYYEDQPVAPEGAAPRRRRRRRGRRWLIALVVLLGLLVAADRVAAAVAESQLASKIQQSQKLTQKPSVSIAGFPFLTQVVSRDFSHATIDIHDLNAKGVPISHIHADLRGVHVSSGYNSATVDSIVSTATQTYADVSTALSNDANIGAVTVSAKNVSQNQVKASYNLLGVEVSADVDVKLLSGNKIEFTATQIHTPLGGVGLDQKLFDVTVPIAGLPFGMQLKTLQVTATGVDISATGTDVVLTGSSVSLTN